MKISPNVLLTNAGILAIAGAASYVALQLKASSVLGWQNF